MRLRYGMLSLDAEIVQGVPEKYKTQNGEIYKLGIRKRWEDPGPSSSLWLPRKTRDQGTLWDTHGMGFHSREEPCTWELSGKASCPTGSPERVRWGHFILLSSPRVTVGYLKGNPGVIWRTLFAPLRSKPCRIRCSLWSKTGYGVSLHPKGDGKQSGPSAESGRGHTYLIHSFRNSIWPEWTRGSRSIRIQVWRLLMSSW